MIVEASEGFRGSPKPFRLEERKARFSKFWDKIIYIKVSDHIETDDPWVRETFQRNQIMRGLKRCAPWDLILISDVDEFIPGPLVNHIRATIALQTPIAVIQHTMYRFFLNRIAADAVNWHGMAACSFLFLAKKSPQEIRNIARTAAAPVINAGWHFSSLGGIETYKEKIENYSHGYDSPQVPYDPWRAFVNTQPLVPIDQTFPRFVVENIPYLTELGLIDTSSAQLSRF